MTKFLVTAGPTREYLDEVRYLSNASSGKMGYAIAGQAAQLGHRVVLVSGPCSLEIPAGVEQRSVVSAEEMLASSLAAFVDCDVAIGVAAVADYRPARRAPGKPAKTQQAQQLALVPNPDIIATLGAAKAGRLVVGFALESARESGRMEIMARARSKLHAKCLDMIVINEVEALSAEQSQLSLLYADGRCEDLPLLTKQESALRILRAIEALAADQHGASGE